MPAYLSTDLIPGIVQHMVDSQALSSAANLLVLNRTTYDTVAPILYRSLVFHTDEILRRLLTSMRSPRISSVTSDDHSRGINRDNTFSLVRSIRLDCPPSSQSASLITSLAEYMPREHLFPNCHTVFIHSNAIKSLPTRVPSASYNNSKSALKVYQSIRRMARPQYLRIIRPSLNGGCTAYREMHTYFLSAKADRSHFFQSLKDHWPELERVEWGQIHTDDALAVLGVENVYDVPNCECVSNETFGSDLYTKCLACVADGERPVPRAKMVLRGEEAAVRSVQKRMDDRHQLLWADEEIPHHAKLDVSLESTETEGG